MATMTEPVTLPELSTEEMARYSRHLLIPEIGEEGQLRLLDSKILLIGAGGLGSPASLYLAAAGVGHLGIIDRVEEAEEAGLVLITGEVTAIDLRGTAAIIPAIEGSAFVTGLNTLWIDPEHPFPTGFQVT